MTRIYNRNFQKPQREELRREMTSAEAYLWAKLKENQLSGIKFRRQFGVANYIVDFYSPSLKLAIEVDGEVHNEPKVIKADAERQRKIESRGIKVVRYTNKQVIEDIESVLSDLRKHISAIKSKKNL